MASLTYANADQALFSTPIVVGKYSHESKQGSVVHRHVLETEAECARLPTAATAGENAPSSGHQVEVSKLYQPVSPSGSCRSRKRSIC
jgi:hypothetical protein